MNDDPQNQPLPEFSKAPSRHEEFIMALLRLLLVVARVCIKLVFLVVAFFVAFITAIAWRK